MTHFFETFWRSCEIVCVKQISLLFAALALFACNQKSEVATPAAVPAQPTATVAQTAQETATTATTVSLPPGHPAMGATAGNIGAKVTGTVAETFDAAGYTYLKLKTDDGDKWAAVRQTPVKQGQTVTMTVQMTAEKFESKTLKRTFDRILFGSLEGPGAAPVAAAQQHMSAPAAADNTPIKVAKAEGSDAKSVAEVWASREALKDGKVVVRGKVVKFLGGIMGKNWIHLRDGSGSAADGTNDVLVTTLDETKIGDVVLARGTVRTDVNLGSGYAYKVLVDEAKLQK